MSTTVRARVSSHGSKAAHPRASSGLRCAAIGRGQPGTTRLALPSSRRGCECWPKIEPIRLSSCPAYRFDSPCLTRETAMRVLELVGTWLSCGLIAALITQQSIAGQPPNDADAKEQQATAHTDGQHDFDFELGTWKTHVSRLLHPLTGSATWVDLDGKSVVRKVWDGRANLLELDVEGASGRIEGLSLRLYNPETHQWSLNFANSRVGALTPPTIGAFKNGRGEFYGKETLNDRPIDVRFVIWCSNPDTCHFEQAFSADAGKTWEVNWKATDTRLDLTPAR